VLKASLGHVNVHGDDVGLMGGGSLLARSLFNCVNKGWSGVIIVGVTVVIGAGEGGGGWGKRSP